MCGSHCHCQQCEVDKFPELSRKLREINVEIGDIEDRLALVSTFTALHKSLADIGGGRNVPRALDQWAPSLQNRLAAAIAKREEVVKELCGKCPECEECRR
jgi:hypothetical protein